MEAILKFENRENLFKFLIDEFNVEKIEEQYNYENFGNFFITLSAEDFMLRYINDRGFLTIEIASAIDPEKWYDLSFVRDFVYNKEKINADERKLSNNERVGELNSFLKKDFNLIRSLFSQQNYPETKYQLATLLKKRFDEKFR
jgi:hypothetical protein